MIATSPLWVQNRPHHDELWPGRLRFDGPRVVREWYCLDRADGSILWERPLEPLNHIAGIHGGVALCSRIQGGWRPGVGAAALRVADGELLWSRPLTAVRLDADRFLCIDGDVHDLNSGTLVTRQTPPSGPFGPEHRDSVQWSIVTTQFGRPPVPFGDDLFLTQHGIGSERRLDADYCATNAQGALLWSLSLRDLGWWCSHSRGERLAIPPFIYLLASRKRPYRYVSVKAIEYVACRRFLLVIDARLGRIVQEIDLGVHRGSCVIGDVDERGLVLELADDLVTYFRRADRPG